MGRMRFCSIPAGGFWMGSDPPEGQENEHPRRRAATSAYEIGETPVTNAEFAPFVRDGLYLERRVWNEAGWAWRTANGIVAPRFWNDEAWRHCLPQSNAWFVSVEQGSLAAARLGRYGWDRVHSVRIGSDWMRELKRLQTFGRLASNSPQEGQVYVDAPHAWREVAAGTANAADASGLQWLEEPSEPSEPMTTLQRLGRTRRLAA